MSATSIVVLLPTSIAIAGAYFPHASVVGAFGVVINTGLPWLLAFAAISTGLAGAAVVLGGNKTIVLFFAALTVFLGAAGVGIRYVTFASAQGASYDFLRATDGFPPIPERDRQVIFANVGGQDLRADLWLPPASTTSPDRSVPAVVFIHGGAFVAGNPGTRPQLLGGLRDAGIVAVDIDYRLSPPPRWDQASADVLCALVWLRAAPELAAIDHAKVVLVGESAGGSLALVAGFAAGTDAIESSCPDGHPPVIPAGVAAIAPTADLAGIWADGTIHDYSGRLFPEAYIGGSPTEFPHRYAAASPFRLLRDDLPPTLIIAAESDRLVLPHRVTSIADEIRTAGSECDLVIAPFAGHGFDGEPNSFGQQLTGPLIREFVRKVTS